MISSFWNSGSPPTFVEVSSASAHNSSGVFLLTRKEIVGSCRLRRARRLQHHVGDRVAGILPGFGIYAADGGVEISIADADYLDQLTIPPPYMEFIFMKKQSTISWASSMVIGPLPDLSSDTARYTDQSGRRIRYRR